VAVYLWRQAAAGPTSSNSSVGVVFTPSPTFSATADAYRIDVRDRLNISQSFTLTSAQRTQLIALGVTDAANLNSVNFLTNAFDTRTEGVDVVASYRHRFDASRSLTSDRGGKPQPHRGGAVRHAHRVQRRADQP
jgi:iron complex outermembrane receptor protein